MATQARAWSTKASTNCCSPSTKGVSTHQRRGEGMQLPHTEGEMLAVTKNRTLPFSKACPIPSKMGQTL